MAPRTLPQRRAYQAKQRRLQQAGERLQPEPDGFRTDSPLVVTTNVQGGIFLPRSHRRAYVQILGAGSDGQVIPPRYRPRPNSPVFPLNAEETARC